MSSVKKQTVSDTDKLFTAKTFKTEGNEFHKKKEFKKAIGKYHRALLQLKAIGQSKSAGLGAFMSDEDLESMGYSSNVTEEVQAETTQLLADCYNNLAGTDLSKSAQDEMAITRHPPLWERYMDWEYNFRGEYSECVTTSMAKSISAYQDH